MKIKQFNYRKINRFNFPIWEILLTFVLDFKHFRFGVKYRKWNTNPKGKFLDIFIYPFSILFGYKNYYSWK